MKRRAMVALLVLATVAPPVWAGIPESAALLAILDTLRTIHMTLQQINDFVRSTRDTLEDVYPSEALQEIRHFFQEVRSIKDEISSLSCDWRFSARTRRLWDGVFGGLRLCKPEWRDLYGEPPPHAFQDLDEYEDYQAVRRLNMVASRVESGEKNKEFMDWLLYEAKRGRSPTADLRFGPGYSQRLSALGAAAVGNLLLEQGDTLTAELELVQERVNEKRLHRKLRTELAVGVYAALADEELPESAAAATEVISW